MSHGFDSLRCAITGLPVLLMGMQRSRAHILWLTANFTDIIGTKVNLTEVFDTFEKIVFCVEAHSRDVFVAFLAETLLTVIKSEIRVVVLKNFGCWAKAPTIGILVGNTRIDEDHIGASYHELESTMNRLDRIRTKQGEATLLTCFSFNISITSTHTL